MHLQAFEPLKTMIRNAGQAICEIYEHDFAVQYKSDTTPLTQADLAAHAIIQQFCVTHYPHIDFISEEGEFKHDYSKELAFMCDPLDGTKEFVARNGEFTVNLALLRNDRPILGIIYAPISRTMFYAMEHQGAFMQVGNHEPVRIHTSQKMNQFKAVISRTHVGEKELAFLRQHQAHIALTTPVGSSLKGCIIAAGFADVYVRYGPTQEWDIAAMDILVHEAGGVLQSMDHTKLTYRKEVSANPHFYVLNTINNKWLIK